MVLVKRRCHHRIKWQFLHHKYTLVSCKQDVFVSCLLEWCDVVMKDVMMLIFLSELYLVPHAEPFSNLGGLDAEPCGT